MTSTARQHAAGTACELDVPQVSPAAPITASALPNANRGSARLAAGARQLFALVTISLMVFGWWLAWREEFTPADGIGYWLGVAGGTLLLLQFLYPLRKRLRLMRNLGTSRAWFRAHMILGVMGPLLILYHCNYSLGATNSNVALIAMLTVAISGIVGRYFYGKIHNGLYGARTTVQDLLGQTALLLRAVEYDVGDAGGSIATVLTGFGTRALGHRRSFAANLALTIQLSLTTPILRWRLAAALRRNVNLNAARHGWSSRDRRKQLSAARAHVDDYLAAVTKAAELSLYERLFALWHILHMPLFLLLFLAGIAHVIAVHLY